MNGDLPKLSDLEIRPRYSSGQNDLVAEFFAPCLARSETYDRAVGYFSSTFYSLIDVPLADFAEREGAIRLVCSPQLSGEDYEAIQAGYVERAVQDAVNRELDDLIEDPTGRAAVVLLGTLVAAGVVEIRVAFNANEKGIFHDKVGIFTDSDGSKVSFTGSANETWSAWSGLANHESFHAFSTATPEGVIHVEEDVLSFERLWISEEPMVEVVEFPEVARERIEEMADPDGVRAAEERLTTQVRNRPPRPTLREHQRDALAKWIAAGHRGIFEHATGSGKTITALACIDVAVREGEPVLVLVPGRTLLAQWRDEIRAYFGGSARLLLAGDHYSQWREGSVLRDSLSPGGGAGRIVLATMDTAASEDFLVRARDLTDLLVVADEVHRIASPRRRLCLEIDAAWRLGLSATWQREGDAEGTQAIENYFGPVIQPPYTLADAIADGHLCRYRYLVHQVALDDEEQAEWREWSARIGQAIARAGGEMSESARQLLIQRARVIKGARQKVRVAQELLAERYQVGQAWLVYCDSRIQLAAVKEALAAADLHSFEYHTGAGGDMDAALTEFSERGGIMLSINCLDEGVDIPRVSHALILASSSTRREFIQRRGRVLRQHETKSSAVIHDLIVNAQGFDDPQAATFVRTELARALEFARSADESSATVVLLERLAAESGLEIDAPDAGEGMETDNGGE